MFILAALTTQSTNNWSSSLELLGRFFSIILAIVFVMVLAYFSTRWVAGARYAHRGKSNLKLLEGVSVGYQANVQLLQAGEKFILVGVTKERVTFLAEIPKEQITEAENILPAIPFEKYLKAFGKKSDESADENTL